MKFLKIIIFLFPVLTWAHGHDIYADDEVHGEELIEQVEDIGEQVESSIATIEVHRAMIECTKDKINSKLSYCTIKRLH